jgi:hypothetical protein
MDAVHVSSNRVYTIGYGGKKPVAFFEELSSLNYDIVVDVREDPDHAYLGCYTRKHLEKQLKEHYIWISELGNRTRTLPPTLVDEKIGMEKLHKLYLNTWLSFFSAPRKMRRTAIEAIFEDGCRKKHSNKVMLSYFACACMRCEW